MTRHADKAAAPSDEGCIEAEAEEAVAADPGERHGAMLDDLIGQTHAFAMEYFGIAGSTDASAPGRTRKINLASKLSALTGQLISISDRHCNAKQGD